MSQNDYEITTADANTGVTVRAALNAALQALASNNSGASAPTTTYAYQLWADTTTGLLKIRNAANNAWIIVGTLADAYLGLLPLSGGSLSGVLNEKQVSIAAATSTDILGAAGNSILMTGNSPITITGLGTSTQAGARRHVTSTGSGAHILTHNATSLILPTGANITVAQGDGFWVEDLGSNNARVYGYHRADGTALVGATAAAGQIIQVVSATKTDIFSSNSTVFTDITGLSVTITPSSASNKILVMASWNVGQTGLAGMLTHWQFTRNGTAIGVGDAAGSRRRSGLGVFRAGDAYGTTSASMQYLDSPASTSELTYKLQGAKEDSGTTFRVNYGETDADNTSYGSRNISTIIVMEVKG